MKDSTPADEGFFLKSEPTGAMRFSDSHSSFLTFNGYADGAHFPLLVLYADGRVVVGDKLSAEGTAAEVLRLITEQWGKSLARSMGVEGAALAMDALSPEDFARAVEKLRKTRCLNCGDHVHGRICQCDNDE